MQHIDETAVKETMDTPPAGVATSTDGWPVHFQLERFEWLVNTRDTEAAGRELVFLLNQLDQQYGEWGSQVSAFAPGQAQTLNVHLCTRLAGAITTLFSRPDFNLSQEGYRGLMGVHRWLALVFAVSPYRHADHIIRNRNAAGGGLTDPVTVNESNIYLFCLCYFPDSEIALQPDTLWQYNRDVVVTLFFALLSGRALPTPAGHAKKEMLLAWLPEKLGEITSLDFLPKRVLHDVYMHCSYADLPAKHQIKAGMSRLLRQELLSNDYHDMGVSPVGRSKPVVAVVLEWFTRQHSIYRTHSTTMRALKEKYEVVGIAQPGATDDETQGVFDRFEEIPAGNIVRGAYDIIRRIQPDIIYYPSVGMFPLTMYLVNLRLAPLQLMALGHPATTHSPYIDGILVEEDYVGEASCFSEHLLQLPCDGMPYIPPQGVKRTPPERRSRKAFGERVRVAVCASVMKINPGFLNTLAEITRRSRRPVQFCFYMGFAKGITTDYLRQAIQAVLPDAEVNSHMAVDTYQAALNSCDLFVNPFPFGNTNGLVDTVRQGLPGVCMTGAEVHTHIDEGLFRRLKLPESLIAQDTETYIRAALSLIENDEWRHKLQLRLCSEDVEQVLFKGQTHSFVQLVTEAYKAARHRNEE
ncbi:cobalt ABC transporter permease [Salmonella enterica]|nr:cobalt ABC transporter permease [Salmonella enterica]MDJ7794047.1 cobalt ABC transporter permease [Salmonella enterica]MDJ7816391.1 cobalt ABC transporter permease [Salmonella enterica]MDJ7946347.1 cobalt ABC transporter permease [Salmonella enterica]MDJ8034859.1 cobalt ABC transporter permease [Salmonella enterica]